MVTCVQKWTRIIILTALVQLDTGSKPHPSNRTLDNIVVGKFNLCKCNIPLLWLILANTTN